MSRKSSYVPEGNEPFAAELKAQYKKRGLRENRNRSPSAHSNKASVNYHLARRFKEISVEEENTGVPKQLVKGGEWQAPPEERPDGWQKLGVKEKKRGEREGA